jgi:hypothetical protein
VVGYRTPFADDEVATAAKVFDEAPRLDLGDFTREVSD